MVTGPGRDVPRSRPILDDPEDDDLSLRVIGECWIRGEEDEGEAFPHRKQVLEVGVVIRSHQLHVPAREKHIPLRLAGGKPTAVEHKSFSNIYECIDHDYITISQFCCALYGRRVVSVLILYKNIT